MAQKIQNKFEVFLNSLKYTAEGPIYCHYQPRQAGKINTGPDGYDKDQFLSHWIIKDQTGGGGIDEMDESIHADRYWWTNCITDQNGHILLPRLATAVTLDAYPMKITDPGLEAWNSASTPTSWTIGAGTCARQTSSPHSGTYYLSIGLYAPGNVYQDLTTWNNNYRGKTAVFKVWYRIDPGSNPAYIEIYDGVDTTTSAAGSEITFTQLSVSHTFNAAATGCRVILRGGDGTHLAYFDGLSTDLPYRGTTGPSAHFANFNGYLYLAVGNCLFKLDADGDQLTLIESFETEEAGSPDTLIKKLIPSLNSCLYIFLGDTLPYQYMSTAESFTVTNVTDATHGVQWDNKLVKLSSTGEGDYATTPNSATPSWTTTGDITDVGEDVENLLVAPDANGDPALYAPTHGALKILDLSVPKWMDTAVHLADHPNGGKGACYFRDSIFVSYGLGIKKYTPAGTASISEVGLNRDAGLPVEFNGEIVKLVGDSGSDHMFALVDASQVSGSPYSSLYSYNGQSWFCWWFDSSGASKTMHDCITSSASGRYAVYWDSGGAIYYMPIPRGIDNPIMTGTQTYETTGVYLSSWFDGGTAAFKKLIKKLVLYTKGVTSTETVVIRYRTNRTNDNLSTGWTTLDTLDSTGESGEKTELLASGAGIEVNAFQIRLDLERGSTTTASPDVQTVVTAYQLVTKGTWTFNFKIIIDDQHGTTAATKIANLKTALELGTLIPLLFRPDSSTDTHYVRLYLPEGWTDSGSHYEGEYTIQAIEV